MKLRHRRHFLHLAAGVAALPAMARIARAQAYPTRPVRVIVGITPGGAPDIVARLVGQWLSERLGQQFVVENRPGAGTNLAAELAARSDPDGYTMFMGGASLLVNRNFYRTLSYDPIVDFARVTLICSFSFFMFVPNSSPAKTVKQFIPYAERNKGKLTFASPGTGSAPHLCAELFKQTAGIEMTHVPYRS